MFTSRRLSASPTRLDDAEPRPQFDGKHGNDAARRALRPVVPPLEVRIATRGRVRVVEVEGEVDLLTAPTLAAAVDDRDAFDALVLDLAKVPFVDSSGLRLIASLHRRLSRRDGGGVVLVGVQPFVAKVLEIVGLAEVVLFAADVATATNLLTEGPDAA